jgi:bis(5'-nucleosidyl)-tetraphosphatase
MKPETRAVRSCGFLIIRGNPVREFLLMRHHDRWDIPKGHVDEGESDMQCALRELDEETGIKAQDIEVVPGFRFTLQYLVYDKHVGGQATKTLIVFLARLNREVEIAATEHVGYEWFPWNPPHQIQTRTIDPLLAALANFLTV